VTLPLLCAQAEKIPLPASATKVVLAGIASVSVTLRALLGPALATVIV
jgi:hypothetical protein